MTKKPKSDETSATTNHQFPAIIELARKAHEYGRKEEDCLFLIGEALVKDCGEVGEDGVNNESRKKMLAVAEELKQEGLGDHFSYPYLRKLRKTGETFTAANRLAGVSWTVHDLAGNFDNLNEMVEKAKSENKPLTASFAREFLTQRRIANNIQAQAEGKDDPKKAVLFCIDHAKNVKTGAIKLIKLATHIDTRISPLLSKIERRKDLSKTIQSARDQVLNVVAKLDELLQKVGAGAA